MRQIRVCNSCRERDGEEGRKGHITIVQKHTFGGGDRQRDRQTDRQTDRLTDRQTKPEGHGERRKVKQWIMSR